MLTKEQIAKLPVEEQETLATVELGRARRRQLLLQQARGLHKSWRAVWAKLSAILLTFGAIYFVLELRKASPVNLMVAVLGVVILNFVVLSHSVVINRRLDALMELLDEDGKL
jgi:hypothetical protein